MDRVVLVTGGNGFVAGWCMIDLLERGCTVRATMRDLSHGSTVRTAVDSAGRAGDRLTFVQADLTSDAAWGGAMAGCDYVLHVASPLGRDADRQRFIAAGDFMWMEDIATTLRSRLGEQANKVPTRRLPDVVVRSLSLFVPQLRTLTADLGRRNALTSDKARRVLGFAPRPATDTVVDCARSLLNR